MQTRSVARSTFWTLALLFSTLACRAATRLIIPDTPTPFPPTPTATLTATPFPTLPPPTPTPIFEAACPSLLSDIMASATTEEETDEESSGSNSRFQDNQDFQFMVTYTLRDDKLSTRKDIFIPKDFDEELSARSTHEWVWDYFAAVIPSQERNFLTEFSVMSDGRRHLLAAVSRTFEEPNNWGLRVDIQDARNHYLLTFTLMHEFGHLLTLNSEQVALSKALYANPDNEIIHERAVETCPQYFSHDGCSTQESYISEFFNRYWAGFHAEWQEIDKTKGKPSYEGALHDFYKIYDDQFLTDYAATSPEEDIAESWVFFVLAPKPEPTSIAKEKILFFYEYPELVQLRQQILNNLCVEFPQ